MKRRKLEAHANGHYYARIRGKRFNCGTNEREAYAQLRLLERDIATGKISFGKIETSARIDAFGKRDIHLDELAHLHLEWVSHNRSPATYEVRKRNIDYFRAFVGSCMVAQITRDQIENFYQTARQSHGRGVNAGNHALREIKTMLNWGVDNEICDLSFRRWPVAVHRPAEIKKFTAEEMSRLLNRVPKNFQDTLLFALFTGLRPRELRELTFRQVVLEGGCPHITIEQHKTSSSAKTYMPRSVPLAAHAVEIIQRQRELHPQSTYVFLDGDGQPYERNALRKRLNRWCSRAGITACSPYALRHYFGTIQGASGTNLALIAQMMGHSNIQTTTRYIANVDVAHQRAAGKMEESVLELMRPKDVPASASD
ncbi:MAG: site-specific integrase [Kiritimatiellaeota bacterium]|nr:site-specific integrase [Kiritimatiellota bacterium]